MGGHFFGIGMIQYLHSSMYGTYYIECEIIQRMDENTYLIKYTDPYFDDIIVKEVNKKTLKFPDFGDTIIG